MSFWYLYVAVSKHSSKHSDDYESGISLLCSTFMLLLYPFKNVNPKYFSVESTTSSEPLPLNFKTRAHHTLEV